MKPKPGYATPIVHFFDGSHFTRNEEPKTPCSKLYGEGPIDQANNQYRLTDNLEEVSCPVCFRVVEEGREEPEPRVRWAEFQPKKKPGPKQAKRTRQQRRAALRARVVRVRKLMMGALALVALRRRG